MTHVPKPNFLYIGTSKAGSTWLFNALALHQDVFLAANKGLYYFDQHYDQGEQWYLRHFVAAAKRPAAGEISHSYLSSPEAVGRIAELNPRMRLLACLREPVDRAFSDYLDLRKNDLFDGPFDVALERFPRLLEQGRYATHLQRYFARFPREQVLVQLFDDLRSDPQRYADEVFDFLRVRRLELPPSALRPRQPAGMPRNAVLVHAARSASELAKRAGFRRFRSRVKRSVAVRQALYRPYTVDRPSVEPGLAAELRRFFAGEVDGLDAMLGVPVSQRWGYRSSSNSRPAGAAP